MLDGGRLVYEGDTATGIRTYHALQRADVSSGVDDGRVRVPAPRT